MFPYQQWLNEKSVHGSQDSNGKKLEEPSETKAEEFFK